MEHRKLPKIKSQQSISKSTRTPYISQAGLPDTPEEIQNVRANHRTVKDSNVKQFNIGLHDIDESIFYYFNNVIQPTVIQHGTSVKVPVIYGNPERWHSVQKDGYFRDKNGKMQAPIIMVRRTGFSKNRELGNKLDGNNPSQFGIFEKKYSNKNRYDKFNIVTNRIPVKEYYGVIVPDYVNMEYECVVFTDFVEQMNPLIESINFASDSYWGNPEKFSFRATISEYAHTVEVESEGERTCKTAFKLSLLGHIVPNTINTGIANMNRYYSKAAFKFGLETTYNSLTQETTTQQSRQTGTRFYDEGYKPVTIVRGGETLTDDMKEYLTLVTVLDTNERAHLIDISNRRVIFYNTQIATPPSGFPSLNKEDFNTFINGLAVEISAITSIQTSGNDLIIQFNSGLDYELLSDMEIVSIGKYVTQ